MNSDLLIEQSIKEIYQTKGYVTIKNFLKEDYAEEFHKFLINMNPTWWYHSSIVDDDKIEIRNTEDEKTQQKIESRRQAALKSFSSAKIFSYSFYRTINNHYDSCNCFLCKFDENIITSERFKSLIEEISDEKNLTLGTYFYTEYKSGDFLYPHTDSPNGKVAIVLHLTNNWSPWFGGNLCILDNQYQKIRETLIPKFNHMTVMKIAGKINPHFVEYIPQNVREHRFAMVCWFT